MSQAWLETIFRASWQGALLVVAVWALTSMLRQTSAKVRARLWLIALSKFFLLLFLMIELPVLRPESNLAVYELVEGPAPVAAFDWSPLVMSVWAIGVSALLVRAVLVGIKLRRLVKEAIPADVAVEMIWHELEGSPNVVIATHPEARIPMLVGLVRPVILLPESLDLSVEELRMVLAHEAAHLRRRDVLSSVYVFSCLTLFFFHPLVWLAQREWQHDREAACDADALASLGADPHRYAAMLVRISAGQAPPLLALSAAPQFRTLHRRIKNMKQTSSSRLRPTWMLMAFVVAAAAAPIVLVPQTALASQDPKPSAAPTPVPMRGVSRASTPKPAPAQDHAIRVEGKPIGVSQSGTWVGTLDDGTKRVMKKTKVKNRNGKYEYRYEIVTSGKGKAKTTVRGVQVAPSAQASFSGTAKAMPAAPAAPAGISVAPARAGTAQSGPAPASVATPRGQIVEGRAISVAGTAAVAPSASAGRTAQTPAPKAVEGRLAPAGTPAGTFTGQTMENPPKAVVGRAVPASTRAASGASFTGQTVESPARTVVGRAVPATTRAASGASFTGQTLESPARTVVGRAIPAPTPATRAGGRQVEPKTLAPTAASPTTTAQRKLVRVQTLRPLVSRLFAPVQTRATLRTKVKLNVKPRIATHRTIKPRVSTATRKRGS